MWTELSEKVGLIDFINEKNIADYTLIYFYYKTNLIGIERAHSIREDYETYGEWYIHEWEYSSGQYFLDVDIKK